MEELGRFMNIQFGRWNLDGQAVDREYLDKVMRILGSYASDEVGAYEGENLSIRCKAFHTTHATAEYKQPYGMTSGAVITWDGRLDNRSELIRDLRNGLSNRAADISIVAAAYEKWGNAAFSRVLGDWALSIWDPRTRTLLLAKDPLGIRQLYYSCGETKITWSTLLEPLALFADHTLRLNEEYIAGRLSFFPAPHLTPYVGIHSVPPSCFVLLTPSNCSVHRYWDFDSCKKIHYATDAEYEEHFRAVFAASVRRRLCSDRPILAELSGGMDSSAIVCMADAIINSGTAETPRLDTVSYYNDSEPDWDERPYFTRVEEKRRRIGCHIDLRPQTSFEFENRSDRFAVTPESIFTPNEAARQFGRCITTQGNRVVLSGFAGDEVTGGVPTPLSELADLLATFRFKVFTEQLKAWALSKRKPWLSLLFETACKFFSPALVGIPASKRPAPWLDPNFVKRHRAVLSGYARPFRLSGPLPSFQDNLCTLDGLRRQLGSFVLSSEPCYEKRYPFLDRDFLEFLFSLPREQLLRPGQRRSLMRRALVGVVPHEILQRRRKAFVVRAPMAAISNDWTSLTSLSQHMVTSSLGIVDRKVFLATLQQAHNGIAVPLIPLVRTLVVEYWLRDLLSRGTVETRARRHASDW
jgi:asparagine synthase (glutamine-hydrolysing)